MIEIFLKATDFENLFEKDIDDEIIEANQAPNAKQYWERVFGDVTTDAHKLFKSSKNKMYVETFEEILRKILRYRNH